MKECFIFFDNDGVTSSWETWRTDVSLDVPTLVNVNIYKWNTIDKFCRRLHENINVNAVCISCWKEVFDDKKNVETFTKLANIQRIKFLSDEEFIDKRFANKEPLERIGLINAYLEKYNPHDYIIIDDEFHDTYSELKYRNIIKTDLYDGFTFKNYLQLKQILLTWGLIDKYAKMYKNEVEQLNTLLAGVF